MSTHPIPSPAADPEDSIRWERLAEIRRLCRVYLREPEDVTDDGTSLALVFTPDLTAGEAAILGRLVALSGLLRVTPAEWAALEPDIDGLRQYAGLGSPTAAQTAQAMKATIRLLRAILRD